MNQCQAKCEADKNCGYYDWHNKQSKHYGVCHLFMNESDGHTLKGEGHKWGFCNQKPGSTSTGLVTYKHTTILGETYVGCFVDQGRRDLPKLLRAGYGNYKACFQQAKDAGFRYAGLQYSGECWAGNDKIGKYG